MTYVGGISRDFGFLFASAVVNMEVGDQKGGIHGKESRTWLVWHIKYNIDGPLRVSKL